MQYAKYFRRNREHFYSIVYAVKDKKPLRQGCQTLVLAECCPTKFRCVLGPAHLNQIGK